MTDTPISDPPKPTEEADTAADAPSPAASEPISEQTPVDMRPVPVDEDASSIPAVPPEESKRRGPLHPRTLTDRVRGLTHRILHPLGVFLYRRGVHPDQITIAGTGLVFLAAALIGAGQLQIGAILLLMALPLDAVDGAVARAMKRTDQFGALLDSSLDRFADAAIFAGLGYYFADQGQLVLLVLAFAALMGTFGVSYVRARAEGLGVDVKIGLFSRMERIVIVLIMLFVPELLPVGVVILALGTNFTSIQRLVYVYRVLKQREG